MLVSELIELLQGENPDAEVHFHYNYGDHWRTQVAPKVTEVFAGQVVYSDYHRMPKLVDSDDYDEDDNTDSNESQVVIIG